MKTLACKTPYDRGGMGAHFAQVVEETRAMGELRSYFSTGIHKDDELIGQIISQTLADLIIKYPLRYTGSLKHYVSADLFDRSVARAIKNEVDCYGGFAGQFLHAAKKARRLGARSLELHSATAHISYTKAKYDEAYARWPIEKTWLHQKMVDKQLQEYALADKIYVNSEYTRQSFLDYGIPADKLERTYLQTNPRFKPADEPRTDETFRVVCTGSISITKGTQLLLEAFSRLQVQDAELVLVGGWATREMRKYMQEWKQREPRLVQLAGDPLPYLLKADCYVHPSFQDGYGYAPMEAMMCGVPVIVTEDTGMKENVIEGENGYVVPTGSWEAILEQMYQVYKNR